MMGGGVMGGLLAASLTAGIGGLVLLAGGFVAGTIAERRRARRRNRRAWQALIPQTRRRIRFAGPGPDRDWLRDLPGVREWLGVERRDGR